MLAASFLCGHPRRREQLGFGGLERLAFPLDGTEETGLIRFVPGRGVLLDLGQQGIAVAIKRDVLHNLRVAAFLALHPELLARAAPEMRPARLDGFLERRSIHPSHHDDAAALLFLDDRRDQSVRVKFQFVVEAHSFSPQWRGGAKNTHSLILFNYTSRRLGVS